MNNNFNLPDQTIKESKKKLSWYIEHANRMIEHLSSTSDDNLEIQKLMDVYNCVNNKVDDKKTDAYGFMLENDYEVYPLAEIIVDQIVQDYLSRPLKRKTYSINTDAINSKLDHISEIETESMMREVNPQLENDLGYTPPTANPNMEIPEDIEEYKKNYKTKAEELGDDLITMLLEVLKQKDKIKIMLVNYLISERSAVAIEKKDKHLILSVPKYDECYFDVNDETEVQSDINVWAQYKYLSETEIYNEYELSKKQKQSIRKMFAQLEAGSQLEQNFSYRNDVAPYVNCKNGVSYKNWYNKRRTTYRLKVLKMYWKSNREINLKIFENKHTGKNEKKLLPDDYKIKKRDNIERINLQSTRYIHMIGPELCLDYGEIQPRNTLIDEPKNVQIPVSAVIGRNFIPGSGIRSVVKKVQKIQSFMSDILYELNAELKGNKSRVLFYDTAQIPKVFLDTYGKNALKRVMHHIKTDKMVFINSKDQKSKTSYNQFTSFDLDNSKAIQTLMDGLLMLEDLARKFVGYSKEKQEGGEKYQTATAVNSAIVSSNMRIETYFGVFDSFISDILNKYLREAKYHYKEGDTFNLIFGDEETKFLTLYKDFFNEDIGLYIGDSSREYKRSQIIEQGAQMAFGNAQTPDMIRDLIDVMLGESASEKKALLNKTIDIMNKAQEERAKQEQANNEAAIKAEKERNKELDALEREKIKSNETVAYIYADSKDKNEKEKIDSAEAIESARLEAKHREIEEKNKENKKTEKSK